MKSLLVCKVCPILRPFLPRTEGGFGHVIDLTLLQKLLRDQVPGEVMRAAMIIILPPRVDDRLGDIKQKAVLDVQALDALVKGYPKDIFHRFARMEEVELYSAPIRPIFQSQELEGGAMVQHNRPRTKFRS